LYSGVPSVAGVCLIIGDSTGLSTKDKVGSLKLNAPEAAFYKVYSNFINS